MVLFQQLVFVKLNSAVPMLSNQMAPLGMPMPPALKMQNHRTAYVKGKVYMTT